MTRFRRGLAALTSLALALLPGQLALTPPALAAAAPFVAPCVTITVTSAGFAQESCQAVTPTFGLPVNIVSGTVTASLGGFTPSTSGSRMTPLSVTTSDSSGTLPTGTVDIISNTDVTNPIYCNVLGVAATVGDQKIPPNSWFAFTIPGAGTTLHCIAVGGTVIANGLGGAGLPTGAGGGGGGGSGSGGPLGVQIISNSQAVNPATASLWTIAQGAAALSASNGIYTNLLQGNAVLSAANPIFVAPSTSASFTVAQATPANLQSTVTPVLAATWGLLAQNATTASQLAQLMEGAVTTATPAYTNAQSSPLSLDPQGNLRTATAQNATEGSCSVVITSANVAQNLPNLGTAAIHGFHILNKDATTGGGEGIGVNTITTASLVSTDLTTALLPPPNDANGTGQGSFTSSPGEGINHAVSVIAPTAGHVILCWWW